MSLRNALSGRIHKNDIDRIVSGVTDEKSIEEVYHLIFDKDERVSYQATWICSHLVKVQPKWFITKYNELTDHFLSCPNTGKKGLTLCLICNSQAVLPLRIDLLNYCLDNMFNPKVSSGLQSRCLKTAYKLCLSQPELLQEFKAIMNFTDTSVFSPAIQSAKGQVMKAIHKKQ